MVLELGNKDYPSQKFCDNRKLDDSQTNFSVYRKIIDLNANHLDDICIIDEDHSISYGQLINDVDKLADVLISVGLDKGDAIFLCNPYGYQSIYVLLACSKIGVTTVILTPMVSEQNFNAACKKSSKIVLFCAEQFSDMFSHYQEFKNLNKVIVISKNPNYVVDSHDNKVCSWDSFFNTKTNVKATEVEDGHFPFAVCPTTGTTNVPKGIVFTNKSFVSCYQTLKALNLDIAHGDIYYDEIILFVTTSLTISHIMPLFFGMAKVFKMTNHKDQSWFENIQNYKASIAVHTRTEWMDIIHRDKFKEYDFSHLKYAVSLGEPMNNAEREVINKFLSQCNTKCKINDVYGLSEANIVLAINKKAIPYTNFCICETGGNKELKAGNVGELYYRNCSSMQGYSFMPEATSNFFIKDQNDNTWGKTVDLAKINEDGSLNILGRIYQCYKDDCGNCLYQYQIEEALEQDNDILRVILSQNSKGPNLHIVLKNKVDDKQLKAQQIYKMLCENLKSKIIPKQIKFRDTFPILQNVKLDIKALKDDEDDFIVVD